MTTEHFIYDGDHIALVFDEAGNQTHRYLHGPNVDQISGDRKLLKVFDADDRLVATLGYKRASRSQYSGTITGYDADQGIAMVGIPTGGTVYAKSITTKCPAKCSGVPALAPPDW